MNTAKYCTMRHPKAKGLSASGGFVPDPLTRGSAPDHRYRPQVLAPRRWLHAVTLNSDIMTVTYEFDVDKVNVNQVPNISQRRRRSFCGNVFVRTNRKHEHTHTCRPVDGTSMNEECEVVMVDHQVCAVRFLT